MGTRTSRHNHGRKPKYKEFRAATISKATWDEPRLPTSPLTASGILAKPAFIGGLRLNQGLNWQDTDADKLKVLCDTEADIEKTADALGRRPKSIAYKALDLG